MGAPKALIILVTVVSHPAALRNGEFIGMYARLWQAAQFATTLSAPGPGFNLITCSAAAAAGRMINAVAIATTEICVTRSLSEKGKILNDVVVIAGRIEDQFGGLRLANIIRGVDHHRILAPIGIDVETPRAECVGAEVLAKCGVRPGFAAIGRHLHHTDAIAAVPSQPADSDFARLHLSTLAVASDQRIDHHLRDRRSDIGFLRDEPIPYREFSKRNAISRIHPEAALRF